MQSKRLRAVLAVAAAGALVVGFAGCASKRSGDTGAKGSTDGTYIFGAEGNPKNFDPIFNDDGASFRPIRQMYDTLIQAKPGTADLQAALATKWEHDKDGKVWTFTLREGVKFHDGTPFNAEAVCFNFNRWHNMKGAAAQSQMIYYGDIFEGFAKNEGDATGKPQYKGCEAKDAKTAVLTLNNYKGAFPGAFVLTAFSISSPEALKKYDADKVTQQGDSFAYSEYATAHPTGTGPFKFVKWDKATNQIELERNDDYWGEKAKSKKLIFKVIPDENARKQEMRAGTIDGFDYPNPSDAKALKADGHQVLARPAFNVLYLGINQKNNPKLKDLKVRQAIAYAVNRKQLVQTKGADGATVADQFMPKTVSGYADDVVKYDYSVDKAKSLLKEAGAENLTLNFYYPTAVTRPYMPNPEEIFQAMANDLQAAGIKVNPVARPWNGGYKDDVQKAGKHDLHIIGWTGDYNDAGNFLGTFFGRAKPEFGTTGMDAMFKVIADADGTVDESKKKEAWQKANKEVMEKYLPAVPIWSNPPGIVVSKKTKGLVPSPLTDERFNTVYKE